MNRKEGCFVSKGTFLEQVQVFLKPPFEGIPMVSAGVEERKQAQKKWSAVFQKSGSVQTLWKSHLKNLSQAKVVLLGVPSDLGAGIRRGAAWGPFALRRALLKKKRFCQWMREARVVDLGDLRVHPFLLHDQMLSAWQKQKVRREVFGDAFSKAPVSVLSTLEHVCRVFWSEFAHKKLFILGGDHSLSWPIVHAMIEVFGRKKVGLIHLDAHTDLLSSRDGVKFCFGTWAYHAMRALGNPSQLVQIGIRQSLKKKRFWENKFGIVQFWAQDWKKKGKAQIFQQVFKHFQKLGVEVLYFTHDIDATDASIVSATGTPVPGGLLERDVLWWIQKVLQSFQVVGADLMEYAPDLAPSLREREKSLRVASQYVFTSLRALLSKKEKKKAE